MILRPTALWSTRHFLCSALSVLLFAQAVALAAAGDGWRALPLIKDGKVDPAWTHIGWGGFVVEDDALRTDPAAKGLGLLVFQKERLGNCQIRVVYKAKVAKANSGVYVRMTDGILDQAGKPGAAFDRDAANKISKESMELMKASAEREEGPWYAVHHGYEVQISDGPDAMHCTGAIYSLAPSAGAPKKAGEWRTMLITLDGERIEVELDGQHLASFDSSSPDIPPQKNWTEPKREPKRPHGGLSGPAKP